MLNMIKSFIFKKHILTLLVLSALSGILSGGSTAGLVALIHRIIQTGLTVGDHALGKFILLLSGYVLFSVLSAYFMVKLSQQILHDLRLMMSQRILMTPLKTIEDIGRATLLSYLSQFLEALRLLMADLPGTFVHLATLFGLYAYIIWLSPLLSAVLFVFLCIGVPLYVKPMALYRKYLQQYAEAQGRLNTFLHALLDGIKELLQHHAKKSAFVNRHLRAISEQAQDVTLRTRVFGNLLNRWGELYLFLGMALILFVLPRYNLVSFEQIESFLLLFLFSLAPLRSMIGFWFSLQRVWVGLQQLESLELQLIEDDSPLHAYDSEVFGAPAQPFRLTIESLSYTYYHSEQHEDFTLGPISFDVHDAQIMFITGGNGSGKSTLAKLLCGLYLPEGGRMTYNGLEVDHHTRSAYRELFSVIFFDFFLFETLLGLEEQDIDEKANLYLERLRLNQKVSVRNGNYSLLSLSQGQRKRLALLRAYLDDRPIYLFDEWAADQDAAFKAIFYEELLPELKQQGKAVIVITHDESYFHIADHIVKLIDGKQVDIPNN